MVRSVHEMLAPKAEAKGITFTVNLAPDLPGPVLGDPVRVRQVVSNLADHGIRLTQADAFTTRRSGVPGWAWLSAAISRT
jgi:two-component system sensor histidine kinase/response regulator